MDSSGSKGATVLQTEDGLKNALDFAFSFSRCHRIIVEHFIEKKHPYLIGGDVFIENGKIVLWGLLNCHRDNCVNPLVPVGKSYPLQLEDEDIQHVKETLSSMVEKLRISNGSTCRKYFGVSDGAFLYTNTKMMREIPQDESFERMHFLLGRFERSANEFYSEYIANNKLFAMESVKKMSRLTDNLLHGIDYEMVAKKRQKNFDFLNIEFRDINILKLKSVNGAFMYPLLIHNGFRVRKKLQKEKVYIPTLWPNVLEECPENSLEYHYAADILPIPVDQRYGIEDMKYLVEVIRDELDR